MQSTNYRKGDRFTRFLRQSNYLCINSNSGRHCNIIATMSDTIEKIYCTDGCRGDNDLATAVALSRNNTDPMAMMAAMNGGMNGWQNNPFIYLVWMMFANRMWGNEGNKIGDAEIQGQLNAIRTQMADNQNSNLVMDAIKGNGCAINQLASNLNCDFNALNSAVCDVRQGIAVLAGKTDSNAERIINSANLGDLNIVQQLKDCCCQTQQNITRWDMKISSVRRTFSRASLLRRMLFRTALQLPTLA